MGMRPTYALFNFEDPIIDAVDSVCGLSSIKEREATVRDDVFTTIRFSAGGATGQMIFTPYGDRIYNHFSGGQLQITVGRQRQDVETVDSLDGDVVAEQDTVSRDPLTHYVAKIRYALRQAMINSEAPHALNDVLTSPKITRIVPGPSINSHDPEMDMDEITLIYDVDYGIPNSVWPNVILTEEGLVLTTEQGVELEAE